ncbi:hypothetical protein [Roseovarius sp. EL26]|uniref:hypothetical protein n=1 Tax=Roseovarius sp. EL26 TaxID=2126672 RepID=UPI000EA264A7|nr:hypothetical protein [Roseovarius sp. EL26]
MIKQFTLMCCAAVMLSACGSTWSHSNVDTQQLVDPGAPTKAEDVLVTTSNSPGRPYTKITDLKVAVNKTTAFHPSPTPELVTAKLKQEAAKIGADAVINTKISKVHVGALSWGVRNGSGEAVKYND